MKESNRIMKDKYKMMKVADDIFLFRATEGGSQKELQLIL
jgi:hypothetical protein